VVAVDGARVGSSCWSLASLVNRLGAPMQGKLVDKEDMMKIRSRSSSRVAKSVLNRVSTNN